MRFQLCCENLFLLEVVLQHDSLTAEKHILWSLQRDISRRRQTGKASELTAAIDISTLKNYLLKPNESDC